MWVKTFTALLQLLCDRSVNSPKKFPTTEATGTDQKKKNTNTFILADYATKNLLEGCNNRFLSQLSSKLWDSWVGLAAAYSVPLSVLIVRVCVGCCWYFATLRLCRNEGVCQGSSHTFLSLGFWWWHWSQVQSFIMLWALHKDVSFCVFKSI